MPHRQPSPRRHRHRTRCATGLLGATALALTLLVAAPAQARVTVPVDCRAGADDETVLAWDDLAYELNGPCGAVRVTADDAHVTMPSASRLVVSGHGTVVEGGVQRVVRVRGRGHRVTVTSVVALRLTAPATTVEVTGLLERARVRASGTAVLADRLHRLVATGDRNRLRARRGYDVRLVGDDNHASLRRLNRLVVRGTGNRVVVRRGATEVRARGRANRIRVDRRD